MSLLMQALRKAERARSQHGHEPEAEHDPEHAQFGADAVPSPPPIEGGPAFAVMPDAWRLEPLDAEPPVIPAQEAVHDPVPPQARHEPAPPTAAASARTSATTSATTSASTAATTAAAASMAKAPPGADLDSGRAEGRGESHRSGRQPARQPVRMPAAIASSQHRLLILAGTLAALVAVFAFIYWRAVSGPGPGARLPMVPMPAPGSPQAAQTGMVQGAPIPVTPYVSAPIADPAATAGGAGIPAGANAAGMSVPPAGDSAIAAGAMSGAPAGGTGAGAIAAGSVAALGAADAGAVPSGGGYEAQATTTAAAPASKPEVDVTIPTPEQLAAIPDPAIRAEAMRDAAERAARQVRTEAVPPPSGTVQASPSPSVASAPSTGIVPSSSVSAPERLASSGSPATAQPGSTRSSRRTTGQSGAAESPPAMQTAVGEHGEVRFTRGAAAAQIAPGVQNGYAALKSGDLATARQQYDLALLQDPNNRDALLGAAAVALRENDGRQASNNFLRLLELDPNDPEALAGLAEMRPGDLEGNEIRLRGLARKHPGSGPVQFSLGNLYARQGRWPEAQQSYFRAYSAMPDNADYAYNLGVGLDHMNQQRLAQTYYRRALELAETTQPAFNVDAVRKRLQALETPPQ